MHKRLTELMAARARPQPGRRVELFDGPGGVPGLCLRITPRGVKSWAVTYRLAGRQHRLTLGRYPELALAQARAKARAVLESAERGEAVRRPVRDTVEQVGDDYLERHVKRNRLRRHADVRRMLEGSVYPAWGAKPIAGITKRDALELIDDIAARAPVMANRVQSLLKRLFAWAVERGILEASPLAGLRPPARERARERVLEPDELAAVWRASDGLGWPFGPITKLLILTGARRAEAAGMRWAEIDSERQLWIKPAERVKSGRAHTLPLPAAALEIIARLPVVDGSPLLFPARVGAGPASGFSGVKVRLDRVSGVTGWTFHDLRRSAASGMARLGTGPHVVGAILDHSPAAVAGITAVYQRYNYEREMRAALERWSDHVLGLAEGRMAQIINL